jgi:hypothetical protein
MRRVVKTLKTVQGAVKSAVANEYFPATAVLAGVLLFWGLGIFGGLSLLSNHQTLLTTLSWLLFVYAAAVLTPLSGLLAVLDLSRRWLRNRASGSGGTSRAAPA